MPVHLVRRLRRLQWQLPLTIAGLLVAVVTVFSWAAYREVHGAALRAARDRLHDVSRQLASILSQGVATRLAETRQAASDSAVILAVARPGAAAPSARPTLDQLLGSHAQIRAVELWDTAGVLVHASRRAAAPDSFDGGTGTFPAWAVGDSAAVSGLKLSGDVVWYELAAPVQLGDGRAVGYLVQRRQITTSPRGVELLTDLIGSDAAFLVGEPGGTWTDLVRPVAGPAVAGRAAADLARYQTVAGRRVVGAGLPIDGTSWVVWVAFPLELVLERPRAFLARIVPLGFVIVLIGAAGGWAVSNRITRRLGHVTAAARALAGGQHDRRVQLGGEDELAELGQAFNNMAASLEAALRAAQRSEERFRHLFASNPLPMWVYDLDTLRFLEVNDAAMAHYGYSREEFLRMRLTDIRPPEDVPRLLADLARQRPELSQSGEWRHRLNDGRIIDVDITSHLLEFGGRRAALVVASDVTERKRAADQIRALNAELERRVAERTAALQASEEQFRTLAATAHDAIIAADGEGCIRYFNPGAERIFGYPTGEVLGSPLTLLMPERFHEPHRQGLTRHVATGEARVVGRTVELVGRRKDGTEFPIELSLASRRRDGSPAFIGIIRDITERKEAEQAIRRYAADLEAANQELEAFSYSVSHDLRAPLRSMHGFSQAVLEDYRDRLDEQGVEYLGRVCAATERMGVLIDDLLELSRASRVEMRRERVDLSRLAKRIAAELAATDSARRVEFRISDGLTCKGDQALLTLVLRNLLQNAWKFTGKRDAAVIQLGAAAADERAYFVRDNGAGFEMAYADKLFQPFQRLHAARDFAGTGIGLALVQRIIQRHGGRAWAQGAVDQGATFYFTLPDA